MGQPCCNMVNIDPQTNYAIKKIVEPEEYQHKINKSTAKLQNNLNDFTLFEGNEISHEPIRNQHVTQALQNRLVSHFQKKNQSKLKHVKIHQAYLQQFKQDQIHSEDQTSTVNLNLFKVNQNQIQYLPKYFRFKKTGIVYHGQWKTIKGIQMPHGQGQCFFPNQSYFQGLFKEGMPHYYGLYINPKGDQYQGQIKYGRAEGSGCYISDQGMGTILEYKGYFKNNQRHGKGIQKSKNYYFQGIFQYDEKIQGLLKYNGITYEGQFHDDKYHGKGKLTLSGNGGTYQGNFVDGVQNGYGQYQWPDGSLYRGNFKDGKRQGYGEFYNAGNQSTAKGYWKNGILSGNGEYINRYNEKIKCIWQNNKISGMLQ